MTTDDRDTGKLSMAVLEKIYIVMSEVGIIEKDATNNHQHYDYASEYAIKRALQDAFIRNRLILNLTCLNARTMELQPGKDGAKSFSTIVDFGYRIIDVDTGEYIGGTFVGSGNGRDDKGVYAAVTGALKYLLTSNFLIPTGDDPEIDEDRAPVRREPKKEQPKPPAPPARTAAKAAARAPVKAAPKAQPKPEPVAEPAKTPAQEAAEIPTSDEPEPGVFLFGHPNIAAGPVTDVEIEKMLAAFGAYRIIREHLESVACVKLEDWTQNMKVSALQAFTALKTGQMTREQLIRARASV